jgi:hypothetical protein
VLAEITAVLNLANHVRSTRGEHAQCDFAVSQKDSIAFANGFGQGTERGADTFGRADNISGGDDEALAEMQMNGLSFFERAGADFRSLQIGENSHGLFVTRRSAPNRSDVAGVLFRRSVRKIQARHVHACAYEVIDNFGRRTAGAERAYDFSFPLHHSMFSKGDIFLDRYFPDLMFSNYFATVKAVTMS